MRKLVKVLYKILAGDVYDFKTGKKIEPPALTIDWNKAQHYPVSGNSDLKILAVSLVGSDKHIMLSLIPSRDGIRFQLDEVGGDFCRAITENVPAGKVETYIKTKLIKDINEVAPLLNVGKITQKLSSKLATMLPTG